MKRYIIILAIILTTSLTFSQWKLDPLYHSVVQQGIDLILKQEYEKADSVFQKFSKNYSTEPIGYLYQAAVMQARSIDYDIAIDKIKFDSLLELGKKYSRDNDMPWGKYFLATADGYDAYERVERGDWFGGVRKGMSSATKYEEIINKDSTFYDAYVGLGTYYYWRSRKTEFLHWLPFIRDDREIGIKLLIKCAEKSEYNRYTAISALISIFLDSEDYLKAEYWSEQGLNVYPNNRIFLWGLATALDRQRKFKEAITAYERLLDNILDVQFTHPYSEIVCRLNLVKCKLSIHDTSKIKIHLENILSKEKQPFPEKLKKRANSKFIEANQLYSELFKK